MHTQSFKTLEFDALRALVRRHAATAMGRSQIEQLTPHRRIEDLHDALELAGEMIEARRNGIRFSFVDLADPSDAIARLQIQGTALEPLTMLELARLCDHALHARAAINNEREALPRLFAIVGPLSTDLAKLTSSLTRKILPNGELDDRASPELAGIRRELATARSRITRTLENLMRRSSEAIQEELVTVRNDRFVIPVRSDHQTRIKGVAHGSSSSGATVFVEPLETIEANNELQGLREAEQREIAEILFRLSEELRRNLPAIALAARAISDLDFLGAKAAFAEQFDCAVPVVSESATEQSPSNKSSDPTDPVATAPGYDSSALEFVEARHPLLEENLRASGGKVVPVSFKLDAGHPVMVISGANAGGKTVVLKTAGLLSLMALSGLPVPAKSAQVPFYRSVLADIGDHQSLAANLSTFTSHVANIASMIEACETPALVMLDEVGTGTDPEEGSALGVAVVDNFKVRGAHVLTTTHYSGLKTYAATHADVLNASVEFDEKTLRPTYRLLVGLAGSSSGLEIARRFGIPDLVIRNASEQVTQSSRDAIEYLRRIKNEAEEAESLRRALEEERAATAEKFVSLDLDFRKREATRQAEFEKALKQSVAEFEKLSRDLLAKIEDRAARVKVERESEKRAAELRREAQQAAKAMSQAARSNPTPETQTRESLPAPLRNIRVVRDGQVVSDARPAVEAAPIDRVEAFAPERELQVGDRVRLKTFGSIGIIDRIKGDDVEVRAGSVHLREKIANLELVAGSAQGTGGDHSKARTSLEDMRKAATTELHLYSKESDSEFQSSKSRTTKFQNAKGSTRGQNARFQNAESQDSRELNLIGKKTDEAVDLVDKFLDQAFLNGATEVRIIHGHGTGALRKAVAETLAGHPHVARFAKAPQDQGGSGATMVELKS